jgi:predicted transcriptional regulator of viral defense system
MPKSYEKVAKIIAKLGGFARTGQIEQAGISRIHLKPMVDSGKLVKQARGIYSLPESGIDEMAILQHSYSNIIFSHATALYLHNLTDRAPLNYTVTLPMGYNIKSLHNKNINCIYVKRNLWNIGTIKIKDPFGETVKTYNKERTICDIIKKRNSLDIQIITDAIKQYLLKTDRNLLLLNKYAKLFRIEKKLRVYLEILL